MISAGVGCNVPCSGGGTVEETAGYGGGDADGGVVGISSIVVVSGTFLCLWLMCAY